MFSLFKFIRFVAFAGWRILSPNLNPMRSAPTHIKYFATVLLASFWSLAFCLYTAQFFYIGINILAHLAIVSVAFLTWSTFRYFDHSYPSAFPQMRDSKLQPKCYELTDAERLESLQRTETLLNKD